MLLVALAVLAGIVYPLFITGIGQAFFHDKAKGSLIVQDGRVAGSALIGQPFSDPGYFWSRPSATVARTPTTAAPPAAPTWAPPTPLCSQAIADRIAALRAADPGNTAPVPDRPGDRLGQRARSRHQPGGGASTRWRGWPARGACRRTPCSALVAEVH